MRHELFPRPRCCPFNQPGPEFTIVQKRIKSDRDDHYNNFLMLIRLLIVKNVFSLKWLQIEEDDLALCCSLCAIFLEKILE